MVYAKKIKRHLKRGGWIEDWLCGEFGKCSDGGHYYDIYQIRNGVLMYRSSREGATWNKVEGSLDEFVEYVLKTWNDTPCYMDIGRWILA